MSGERAQSPRKKVSVPWSLELLKACCGIDERENQEEDFTRAEKMPIWLRFFLARTEGSDGSVSPAGEFQVTYMERILWKKWQPVSMGGGKGEGCGEV